MKYLAKANLLISTASTISSMLYSIVPPILIILSAIGIILILAKKAPQLALMEEIKNSQEADDLEKEKALAKAGFFKKRWIKIKGVNGEGIKHKLFMILEKLTRRFKVMFLKLENLFTSWSENLRKRRHGEIDQNPESPAQEESQSENPEENKNPGMYQRLKKYKISQLKNRKRGAKVMDISQEEEKVFEPIISKEMVTPNKIEVKDRLERLLIERIALNPKDLEAYERLGEYYFDVENYEYAKECFKQVIKLDPKNSNIKYKMRKLERLLWKSH